MCLRKKRQILLVHCGVPAWSKLNKGLKRGAKENNFKPEQPFAHTPNLCMDWHN